MPIEDIIEVVRAYLGGVSDQELPDSIIKMFYYKWKDKPCGGKEPNPSLTLYNTILDCVRWLMASQVSSGESTITERLEKIGDETIHIKSGSSFQSWKDFLDWLLSNPDYIDPCLSGVGRLVIIGGVRDDEFQRVKQNRNSRGPFDIAGIIPSAGRLGYPKRYPSRNR